MGVDVEVTGTGRVVPLAGGFSLFDRFDARIDDPDVPVLVELGVALEAGRLVAERVTCLRRGGGGPVTSDVLPRVPVGRLVRAAATNVVMRSEGQAVMGGRGLVSVNTPYRPEVDVSQGPTPEALEAVAVVYRLAFAVGEPPTRAVAEQLGLARSTAGRWVQRAREAGLLGATTEGRASVNGGTAPDVEGLA